jgi:hypothetical protein
VTIQYADEKFFGSGSEYVFLQPCARVCRNRCGLASVTPVVWR